MVSPVLHFQLMTGLRFSSIAPLLLAHKRYSALINSFIPVMVFVVCAPVARGIRLPGKMSEFVAGSGLLGLTLLSTRSRYLPLALK